MTLDPQGRARWLQLSPLLDELLDLEPAPRAARLAELHAADPALADDLARMLAEDEALQAQGFLAQPAAEALQGAMEEAEAAGPDLAGQALGPYVLERELGQGGMGAVWLARRADGRFEGQVAVKFLKTALFGAGARFGTLGGDHAGSRFAREGQILARLSHPHIARLLDAGVFEGQQPYLVLEYVDGLPIDRYCEQHQLGVDARVKLFLDVLAAVAHAHSRLILHRDLKPTNILVNADGQVKLLDFGIAKLLDDAGNPDATRMTELTQRVGSAFTPQYAAPEQVQQLEVTTATDVYALGVLLYVLLGGRHPTADATQKQLDRLKALVELVPKRLSEAAAQHPEGPLRAEAKRLRGDLDTILAKALKKAPTERYPNAQALADDLQHWLAHEPISARPDSRWYVASRFVRRHRAAVAATSVALLALVSLTIFSVLEAHRAERAEHQAEERRQQSDDLLAYMLGDFADKLRPIGKLDLLDSIGGRALKHLTAEAPTHASERLNRAKALTVIGEVSVARREIDQALEPLRVAQRLLAGEPPEPALTAAWRKAQGAAHFWLGHALYIKRDFDSATVAWQSYLDVASRWANELPNDRDAQVELSYAFTNVGSAALERGHLREAESAFARSVALKRQLLEGLEGEKGRSLTSDLSNTLSWLGTAMLWQGKFSDAELVFRDSLRDIESVRRAAPSDGLWIFREATARRWLAAALLLQGRPVDARAVRSPSAELLRTIGKLDPGNRAWQNERLVNELQAFEALQTLSAEQKLQMVELGRLLEEDGKAGGGAARLRRLPNRAAWARLVLEREVLPVAEGVALAQQIQQQMRDGLATQRADFRLVRGLALLDRAVMRSLAGQGAAELSVCAQTLEDLREMVHLLRQDHEITSAWVEAQSCQGRAADAEVALSREWLAGRR